ncbi:MAG TPA: flagellar filament capping protein FliD [Azonexus sp.]|nr:flagellar filament capping protein FliD [Azonexus sp.]
MASVSSLGVGTGIDLNSILTKLVAVESIPLNQLTTKQNSYKSQLSAFGRIQSAVEKLASASKAIATETGFKGYQATVRDTDYATASATSYASAGSFSLRVDQLAQANKLLSGANPSIAAGSLTIELGDVSSGSFVSKSGTSPVTINFTGSTIEDLRIAINGAQAGVKATIVNGTGGKQLMLTSDETGKTNTIKLTGTAGLSDFSFRSLPAGTAFTEKAVAQDAQAEVDGVAVSSSTNTITDALTGVTVTVKKAHDPLDVTDMTTLDIGNDTAGMTTKVKDFVTAWNELNTLTKDLTKYDTANKTAAALTGDGSVSNLNRQLRSLLSSPPAGVSATYPTMASLGISLQSDGSLKLDETALSSAISNNLSAVSTSITAFGAAFQSTANAMTATGGVVANREDSLNRIIKDFDSRKEAMQRRIDAVQARYEKQFTALDKLMGQMQTQSSYLTQQLAKLG